MGLFDKKFCDICGAKIGLFGNRKLDDGNMCKDCAALLSPFTTDRRKTNINDIKGHLAYREDNKTRVAVFNATRTIGGKTRVIIDEDARKFLVTSSNRWQAENPDIIDFSQVTGCQTEIRESRTEIKRKDSEGKEISYNPPKYDIDYDFYITININSPWFSDISFKINDNRVDMLGSVEYREMERQANEIKMALTQIREEVRESVASNNAPKTAKSCPLCGATTVPDARGCCEYCGGAIPK